jgi:hypothetical protein
MRVRLSSSPPKFEWIKVPLVVPAIGRGVTLPSKWSGPLTFNQVIAGSNPVGVTKLWAWCSNAHRRQTEAVHQFGGCYDNAGRFWSCPGCGVVREFRDLDGYGMRCWRCQVTYDPQGLIDCGLTGNMEDHDKVVGFRGKHPKEEDWDNGIFE